MRIGTRRTILSLALLLASPSVLASDNKAQAIELFREATAAFERRDFATAARAFEASYERVPRAAAMYNAARSWDAGHERERAADAYALAIERTDLADADLKAAKKRLEEIEEELASVDVSGPPGATLHVAHVHDAELPRRVHLSPGEHVVRVRGRDGGEAERRVTLRARDAATLTFEESELMPPRPAPQALAESSREQKKERAIGPEATATAPNASAPVGATLGWISIGLSATSAAAAGVLGVFALDRREAYYDDPTSQDALDRAKLFQTSTNVAWGAAITFAITGVVLLVTTNRGHDTPSGGRPSAVRSR